MKEIKHLDKVLVGVLMCIAIAFGIFLKNPSVKAGIICVCLGLSVFIISWTVKQNADKELQDFEEESRLALVDIAQNGPNSQYFGIVDISVVEKLRKKLIKRNKKQLISCLAIGTFLIIASLN